MSAARARAAPAALGLGFLHPPHLDRLLGQRRANLFVWESDLLPAGWGDALSRGCDRVVVPSRFTREAVERAGVPAAQVACAPYGFDEELLAVEPPAGQGTRHGPFTFLAILTPHLRKGPRELLRAYRSAFRSTDDVLLVLKSPYDARDRGSVRPFELPSWRDALRDAGLAEPGAPAVALEVGVVSDEELLGHYARADVVVAPSWGESFGLVVLEGAASARPVIATAWGGAREILPPGPDGLPFRQIEAGESLYVPVRGALAAEPEVAALAERLRWHRDHPGPSRELGLSARAHVAARTWKAAARELLAALEWA